MTQLSPLSDAYQSFPQNMHLPYKSLSFVSQFIGLPLELE